MQYIIGVDIGGTTIKIGFFNKQGNLQNKWEIPTDISDKGKNIIGDIAASIKEYLTKNKINLNECLGIGIGVPGAVSNNLCVGCVNLGWDALDIGMELGKYFPGILIKAENDANCAALGEVYNLNGKYQNACLITIGTGVGGGIIYQGKILTGSNGASGEIGHFKVVFENGRICGCGKSGCLETVASANGIVEELKRILKEGRLKTKFSLEQKFSTKDIFARENASDPAIIEVKKTFFHYLGIAVSYLTLVTNPEVVIIGGGVSKGLKEELLKINRYFQKYSFAPSEQTEIILAELLNDAGIFGAAQLIRYA
ncbi:MAG: ROK family protein [Erysipelotrichales bacterium]|nr:ROK family protein [Erysipelotrichales bacterium]